MSRIVRLQRQLLSRLRRLGDRRGGVALIFALLVPVLFLFMVGVIDLSQEMTSRNHLQDATDAAALAVAATDAETPSSTEAALKTVATNILAADFPPTSNTNGTPIITAFVLCTTDQTADCGSGGVTNTVKITTQVRAPCWAPLVLPGVCTSDGQTQLLTATNTTNIGLPTSIQMSFVLDVSGSMIVGSMPQDVQDVITWNRTQANWASLTDSEGSIDCAFACHDEGNGNGSTHPTTSGAANSDMDWGITNAHAAGATTRYDVMLKATSAAIGTVQTTVTNNSQLAKNSYYFNIYSFSDNLTKAWSASASQPNDWSDAAAAVTRANLPVGLDTHFASLQPLTTSAWAGGTGNSYTSPTRVVFLVTDGLESDFYSDFTSYNANSCGTGPTVNTAWSSLASGKTWNCAGSSSQGWTGHYYPNNYAAPISASLCSAIKANGITLAVLETPYVPLTGQSPVIPVGGYNGEFYPYEQFVRPVIYPNGPNTSSTVSAALKACATNSTLYQQVDTTDPNGVQAGLQNLVNTYLASNAFLKQ